MKLFIGTPFITTPNFTVKVVKETPKTYVTEIVKINFSAKKSATLMHTFTKGEREWFSSLKGQTRKFWKESRREIGGTAFIVR